MYKQFAALLSFCIAAVGTASQAEISYEPIVFRQDSGTRPFVKTELNGKPFLMMVHANAILYVMTTHANAASAGISGLASESQYGITATGQVSNLGLARTTLDTFHVAGAVAKNIPLQVFEIPQDPPTDGMLGIRWLRTQKVIVDYDGGRIGIPDTLADAQAEDNRLIAKGYIPHKMRWDPTSENYKLDGIFAGQPITFSISTVAQNIIDSETAERRHIEFGPAVDQGGGPEGGVVAIRIVKRPESASIDGQLVHPMQPWSFDISSYHAGKAQSQDSFTIGADFMLANQAVIDFGTETLLLAPTRD